MMTRNDFDKKLLLTFIFCLTFDPWVQLNRNQPVTVHDVLQILRLHVSVPQCDVFGYLSIDHELVVLIAPVDHQPTPLQVTHSEHTEHYRLKPSVLS